MGLDVGLPQQGLCAEPMIHLTAVGASFFFPNAIRGEGDFGLDQLPIGAAGLRFRYGVVLGFHMHCFLSSNLGTSPGRVRY